MESNQPMPEGVFRVRWMPREGMFIAMAGGHPDVTGTNDRSSAAAVLDLKRKISERAAG